MYTKLSNLFNLIVKGLFETAVILNTGVLFSYFFLNVDSHLAINKIIIFSLVNYLCVYGLNIYVFKEMGISNRNKLSISVAAIGLSLISSIITADEIVVIHIIIYFTIYLFVWYRGLISITEKTDLTSAKSSFILNTVIFVSMIIFLNIFAGDSITTQRIKMYFILYIGAALSYFARVNLENAYNKRNINSLNKMKNIKIINIISTSIILIILLFTLTGFFGIWNKILGSNIVISMGNIILKAIEVILYPIVWLIMKLAESVFKRGDFAGFPILNAPEGAEKAEDTAAEILSPGTQAFISTLFNIAKWAVLIIIMYLIIRKMIKAINRKDFLEDEEEDEEREFILTPDEVRKKVKDTLNKLATNISGLFSKNKENNRGIPVIRSIYLDIVLILEEKGYKLLSYLTPKEYLSTLENTKYINAGMKDLTQAYNDFRYGGKEPTDEKVKELIDIKRAIYELSKEKQNEKD